MDSRSTDSRYAPSTVRLDRDVWDSPRNSFQSVHQTTCSRPQHVIAPNIGRPKLGLLPRRCYDD